MRTVIFLVCLCSLLLKGSQYVYTGIHHYSVGYYGAQQVDKRNQARLAGHNHELAHYQDTDLLYTEDLVYEDIEEEQESDGYAPLIRTTPWIARGNPPPSQIAALHYLNNYASHLLPFCSRLPDIYLTQRSLRI